MATALINPPDAVTGNNQQEVPSTANGATVFKICNSYYLRGECSRAESCYYRHVQREHVVLQSRPSLHKPFVYGHFRNTTENSNDEGISIRHSRPLCRYFKRGYCRYGSQCYFVHENPMTDLRSATSSSHLLPSSRSSNQLTLKFNSSNTNNSSFGNLDNNLPSSSNIGDSELCPLAQSTADGLCPKKIGECKYMHREICNVCGEAALHPKSTQLREEHIKFCNEERTQKERSKDKCCGVCFEIVLEKCFRDQKFGILPNCNHCFCFSCIMKWRKSRQFEDQVVRACPECRVMSDFVCPSDYWVETSEDKDKLIGSYKENLSKQNCKYFRQGKGKCPFGNKCFYRHALPDGTLKDVGPPKRRKRNRNRNVAEYWQQMLYMDIWESNDIFMHLIEELSDLNMSEAESDSDIDSEFYDDIEDSDMEMFFV